MNAKSLKNHIEKEKKQKVCSRNRAHGTKKNKNETKQTCKILRVE